jgi:hypothetical protein
MGEYIKSILLELVKGIIIAGIGALLSSLYVNRKSLITILKCYTIYRNEDIRVSLSYLYRIKHKDKYLLVKNRKITGQYQPVGGVYKYYSTAEKYFNELDVNQKIGFNYEDEFKNDLRVKVPSKNLNRFIKWFHSREDRELDPIREFYEELISTNYLSKNLFAYFDYRYIKQVTTKIKYSHHFECNEMLIYTIYELLPTEEQKKELDRMMQTDSEEYKWVTLKEIECRGHSEEGDIRIGEHTIHIK